MAPLRRVDDTVLQRPLRMRHCLGGAAELHFAADVVPARIAERARSAGEADFEGNAVAHLEGGGRAGSDNDTARFVTQRQRLAHDDVPVPVVSEVVQV